MLTKRKWFAGHFTAMGNEALRLAGRRLGWAAAGLVISAALALAAPGAKPDLRPMTGEAAKISLPVVLNARIGTDAGHTRFVVELSDPVKVHVFTLTNPDRLVIDMPDVLWKLNGPPDHGDGAIRSFRYGQYRPGDARFVVDLNQAVKLAEPMVLPPEDGYGYRLVLDLYPTTRTAFEKSSGWPADLRAREEAAAVLAAMVPKPAGAPAPEAAPKAGRDRHKIIVIDPGHGGIDSGTLCAGGLEEKNLVLDEGTKLAKVLRERGYTVYMTRATDVFIPLFDRAPFARKRSADLFISLHADSNPDPRVSGASIYTLSEKGSDKEASALAHKENQSDVIAGVDLSGDNSSVATILIDLAQRDTMNRSVSFAHAAIHDLGSATDILPREPQRSANFVVLRAPDVPAVLIEMGYLSNAADCRQMQTLEWRNRVADAIADAVDRHFSGNGKNLPVAGRTQPPAMAPSVE